MAVLNKIKSYQKRILKYPQDKTLVLHCIDRLNNLQVTISHLEETGVGKTVNSLRKYDGRIGEAAKALVSKWKAMVAAAESSECEEDEACVPDAPESYADSETGEPESPQLEIDNDTSTRDDEGDSDDEGETKSSSNVEPKQMRVESSPSQAVNNLREASKISKRHRSSDEETHKEKRGKSDKVESSHHRSSNCDYEKQHKRKLESSEDSDSSRRKQLKSEPQSSEEEDKEEELPKPKDREKEHRRDRDRSSPGKSSKHSDSKSKHKHHKSKSHKSEKKERSDEKEKDSGKSKSHHSSSHSSKSKESSRDKGSKDSSSSSKGDKSDRHKKELEKSSREKKSSEPSSNSSSSKDSKGKKKVVTGNDGIDCNSGASFAEALGMCSFKTATKKKSTRPPSPTPSTSSVKASLSSLTDDQPPLLSPSHKLEPLGVDLASTLPEISPNYKPLPFVSNSNSQKRIEEVKDMSDNQFLKSHARTKVLCGNKTSTSYNSCPSLVEICIRVLIEHMDALDFTGGVPYDILKPVLERATAQQLFRLEHHNPYLIEDTGKLWEFHCNREFRNKQRQENETYREMYLRCFEEREKKLKTITDSIKQSIDASQPVRSAKLAYVDNVVKPPRHVLKKQAKNGTGYESSSSDLRKKLVGATNIAVPMPPTARARSTATIKKTKAPLMQKALQLIKGGRFKR